MYQKAIVFCGFDLMLSCDGKCNKAWGISLRPRDEHGKEIPDDQLGEAPLRPGSAEGDHMKPLFGEEMNKWCARECERSRLRELKRQVPKDVCMYCHYYYDKEGKRLPRKWYPGQAVRVSHGVCKHPACRWRLAQDGK